MRKNVILFVNKRGKVKKGRAQKEIRKSMRGKRNKDGRSKQKKKDRRDFSQNWISAK